MAKVIITFCALIISVFSSTVPLGARAANSVGNYPIVTPTFIGVVGGHAFELNGTVQVRESSVLSVR